MKASEKLLPQLRFSEFEDGWNPKKLGSICVMTSSKRVYLEDYVPAGIPFFRGKEITELKNNTIPSGILYISNERYNDFKEKYGVPKKEDILVTAVGTLGNVWKVNDDNPFYFKDGNLIWLKNIKENSDFLEKLIQLNTNELIKTSIGSTQKALTMVELRKIQLNFPSLREQQKIASFLTDVDAKITQLTKKKTLLEQYKKGVMQKIFNQELRFKPNVIARRHNEAISQNKTSFPDWEEKKLKEFILNFIVPMRDKPKDLTGEIPWCRIEDFDGKYLSKSKSNQGVTLETVKKMNLKVYPKNTLLVSCSANLGFCAIVEKELITNQTFIGLYPDSNKVDVSFLYHIMKLSSRRLNVLSSGTTISYLSRKQFENFTIQFPCLKEQTKIANFLSDIDIKIEAVNTKIENSKTFKKGLLQQMFV